MVEIGLYPHLLPIGILDTTTNTKHDLNGKEFLKKNAIISENSRKMETDIDRTNFN